MSVDDRRNESGQFQRSPTGPRVNPPRQPPDRPTAPPPRAGNAGRPLWSVVIFVILLAGVGVRAFKDVSRPEAWAYWTELYGSPSLTSSRLAAADLPGTARGRPALAISGTIGVASASWLRARLDEAHLTPGDTVILSSPGGDVGQAIIMGEIIRSRGLSTAVGSVDGSDQAASKNSNKNSSKIKPAFCASACVLIYAGGTQRLGVEGSALGVHRFVSTASQNDPGADPVAETQRATGMILGYFTRMGVSASVVEAMSQTSDIRWLGPKEALAMNLITQPAGPP